MKLSALLFFVCFMAYLGPAAPAPTHAPSAKPSTVMPSTPTAIPSTSRPSTAASINDPHLLKFSFDESSGTIEMLFNQEMVASALDISKIHLQSAMVLIQNVTETFYFQGTYNKVSQLGNSTNVTLYLTSNDYYRLRLQNAIGTNINTTYLSMQRGALFALESRESSVSYNASNAYQATEFFPDTLPPFVTKYSLNMNTGEMNISFSEPINNSTFNLYGLAFQNTRNNFQGRDSYVPLVNMGSKYSVTGLYNLDVSIILGTENLNDIKVFGDLCVDKYSTFLSCFLPFVNDTSRNPVSLTAFDYHNGMLPTVYVTDTTSPTLLSWDFSFNSGVLVLYFSEIVDLAFFNYSSMTLSSDRVVTSSSVLLQIPAPGPPVARRASYINITLQDGELNLFKSQTQLMKYANSSYLILAEGAVVDAAKLANEYLGLDATPTNAMRVSVLEQDTIPPQLKYFTVNLDTRTITLRFTEIIDISSFTITAITIQATGGRTTQSILLNSALATVTTVVNSVRVVLVLTVRGFATIMHMGTLCISQSTCFISYTRFIVRDRAVLPNAAAALDAALGQGVRLFTPNYQRPSLLSWGISMRDDILYLNFSEPVNTNTLKTTSILLASDALIDSSTISVSLSSSSVVTGSKLSDVMIKIGISDAASIQTQPPLCTVASRCFLSLDSMLAYSADTFLQADNTVVRMQNYPVYSLSSTNFGSDTSPPKLLSFSLDMSAGVLTLSFSEAVRGQDIVAAGISLYAQSSRAGLFLQLTSGSFGIQLYGTSVTVILSYYDYTQLKMLGVGIASQISNTFVLIGGSSVRDVVGNYLIGGVLTQASAIVADTTPPTLIAILYDRVALSLTAFFSDVIKVKAIDLSSFNLFAGVYSGTTFALSSGTASVSSLVDTNAVVIYLGSVVATVKMGTLLIGKAGVQSSTNLYLQSLGGVEDDSPQLNLLLPMTPGGAIQEGLTPSNFRLNLMNGSMSVEVPYPGYAGGITVSPVGVTIVSATGSSFTLTAVGGTSFSTDSSAGRTLYIAFSAADYSALDSMFPAPNVNDMSVRLSKSSILDSRSFGLSDTSTLQCRQLIQNTAPPKLVSFTLDMNTGKLSMVFTRQVRLASLSFTRLILSDAASSPDSTLILSRAVLISPIAVQAKAFTLSLNGAGVFPTQRDLIHLTKRIARTAGTIWLTLGVGFATDLTGHFVASTIGAPLQVFSLALDSTPPSLLSFSLDFSKATMTLIFSEAVNASTLIPSYFTLAADPTTVLSVKYTLTTSTTNFNQSIGQKVVVALSLQDTLAIARLSPNLCTVVTNSYVSFIAAAISDISTLANQIGVLFFSKGIMASSVKVDRSNPKILAYNVNFRNGTVDFFFDKVINCAATVVTSIVFQKSIYIGSSFEYYRLTSSSAVNCVIASDNHVQLYLNDDLTGLKTYASLMKSAAYTWLRVDIGAFVQASIPNVVLSIADGLAIQVFNYTAETAPPTLLSYSVSFNGILTLKFSEPVSLTSLKIMSFTFQNSRTAVTYSYPLTASTTFLKQSNLLRTQVFTMLSDYSIIMQLSNIFRTQATTYLWVTAGAAADLSGNTMLAITSSAALQPGPSVYRWSLDMNTGLLSLSFTDPVNRYFQLSGVGVQNAASSAKYTTVLSSTALVNQTDLTSTEFTAQLHNSDLSLIKYGHMGGSTIGIYLTVPYGITSGSDTGTFVANLKSVETRTTFALQIQAVVLDVTPPNCLSFDLNMGTTTLLLTFDEPVIAASLQLTTLTLFSSATGLGTTFTTLPLSVTLTNTTQLAIVISKFDMNQIKIATSGQTGGAVVNPLDRLLIGAAAVSDFFGNYLLGNSLQTLISVRFYTEDTNAPYLVSSVLDLGLGTITFKYSEVIRVGSLKSSNIEILSSTNRATATSIFLTNYSILSFGSDYSVVVNMILFGVDLVRLEDIVGLGERRNNTFFSITGVVDLTGNYANASIIQEATAVYQNKVNPVLVTFDTMVVTHLSVASIQVILFFSHVMKASTFYCSDFVFQNTKTAIPTATLALTDSQCLITPFVEKRNVTYYVALSLFTGAGDGTLLASQWINAPGTPRATDKYDNLFLPITAINSLQMGPQLAKYVLDMNKGTLGMIFSNAIYPTVDPTKVGFYSSFTKQRMFFSHATSSVITTSTAFGGSLKTMTIATHDLNRFKQINPTIGLFSILLYSGAVNDTAGVPLASIGTSDSIHLIASSFFPDTISPRILNITLDMGYNQLSILLDEPVPLDYVIETGIMIQSNGNSSYHSWLLTGGVITADTLDTTITITFSAGDQSAIKINKYLATSLATSFISIEYKSFRDVAGNNLALIDKTAARQVDNFLPDLVRPSLSSFALDMTIGLLTLVFSEAVLPRINTTSITLQPAYLAARSVTLTLTGGTTTFSADQVTAYVLISTPDMFTIKNTPGLARGFATTLMTIKNTLAMDTNYNKVYSIRNGSALLCSSFVADLIPPYVLSVSIDLNAFTFTFVMSELVVIAGVTGSSVSVQSSNSSNLLSASLTSSSHSVLSASSPYTTFLTLLLSMQDMDVLKSSYPLLSSQSTSWVVVKSTFLTDVYGNPVVPILSSAALYSSSWSQDSVAPLVVTYLLDMTLSTMFIKFSESVALPSLNLAQLGMQSTLVSRFGKTTTFADATATVGAGVNGTDMTIFLSQNNQNLLRYNGIGATKLTSFITWGPALISDNAGNFLPPLYDGSVLGNTPLAPSGYNPDSRAPVLTRWYLDRVALRLHFYFRTPVILGNTSSLSVTLETKGTTASNSIVLGKLALWALTLQSYKNFNTHAILSIPQGTCSASASMKPLPTVSAKGKVNLCNLPLQASVSQELYLYVKSTGAFNDFATSTNTLQPIVRRLEGKPVCDVCPTGQYIQTNCTTAADRSCAACGVCGQGKFTVNKCAAFSDVTCKLCSVCAFGQYSSTVCGATAGSLADTVCSPCNVCGPLQYEQTQCTPSAATGCGSCQLCVFPTDALRVMCVNKPAYFSWNSANCCFDENKMMVPCNELGLANMIISVRAGRHFIPFPITSPIVPDAAKYQV